MSRFSAIVLPNMGEVFCHRNRILWRLYKGQENSKLAKNSRTNKMFRKEGQTSRQSKAGMVSSNTVTGGSVHFSSHKMLRFSADVRVSVTYCIKKSAAQLLRCPALQSPAEGYARCIPRPTLASSHKEIYLRWALCLFLAHIRTEQLARVLTVTIQILRHIL
jgi:hypothetical protein